MAEKGLIGNMNRKRVMVLGIIGIILVIAGAAVSTIRSSLRGWGLGIALLVLGSVLLIIAIYMYATKRAQ